MAKLLSRRGEICWLLMCEGIFERSSSRVWAHCGFISVLYIESAFYIFPLDRFAFRRYLRGWIVNPDEVRPDPTGWFPEAVFSQLWFILIFSKKLLAKGKMACTLRNLDSRFGNFEEASKGVCSLKLDTFEKLRFAFAGEGSKVFSKLWIKRLQSDFY